MSHEAIFLATCNTMALQVARKTSLCDTPCLQLVSQRRIVLQVVETVEAASTFCNATRQVATCDTATATCLAIFLRRIQSQYDIIRMPLTFLNTRWAQNKLCTSDILTATCNIFFGIASCKDKWPRMTWPLARIRC